jgi:type IVB pilus formation R64 PilN family outer membrane protein
MHKRFILLVAASLMALSLVLGGCTGMRPEDPKQDLRQNISSPAPEQTPGKLRAARVELTPPPKALLFPTVKNFNCMDLRLGHALQLLLQSYGYALDADETIDLDRNVPLVRISNIQLDQAVFRLLANTGYGFEADPDRKVVRVVSAVTKTWRVPVLNLAENATVDLIAGGEQTNEDSSGFSAKTGNTSGKQDKAKGIRLQTNSVIKDPWTDIQKYVQGFLTKNTGRLLVDRLSGIVTVTDKPRVVKAVDEYLTKVIETTSRQVALEITIMEVNLYDSSKLGVDWTKLAGVVGNGWRTGLNISGAPAAAISPEPGGGGSSLMVGFGDVSAVIGALSTYGRVNMVAKPHMRVINNSTAQMFVGEATPFLSRYQNINSGQSYDQTVETGVVRTGVALSVTPSVGEDGSVQLSVVPSMSDLVKIVTFQPTTSAQVSRPEVTTRELRTQIMLMSGQTVVMGGLIYEKTLNEDKGLPELVKIPWVGAAFGNQSKSANKIELVISIRPVVVGPADEGA